MTDSDPSNTSTTPQMSQAEMSGLARRLHARADSVLMRDQPEQQTDMRTAARLVEQLIHLRSELRRATDATEDESTERHLREILGGG
jgi:hypothetical protein